MDYEFGAYDERLAGKVLPKVYTLAQEPLDMEFRKEFPPDLHIGSEMSDSARVWKVYRKEAEAFDNALLEGWIATLDALLIFAGLFSAVVTAFVIESYQFLQRDNSAYTAAALYILVSVSNHSTGITLPSPPDLDFSSSASQWINGLFFTSILLSLAVAFLSILVKQWITEYRSRNRASARSPRDWARRRALYARALDRWPVAEVVSFLPVLLHIALFLFFIGLVLFLWSLNPVLGRWVIALSAVLGFFYLACTLIPLWIPECPTATPTAHEVRKATLFLVLSFFRIASWLSVHVKGTSLRHGLRRILSTCGAVAARAHNRAVSTTRHVNELLLLAGALLHTLLLARPFRNTRAGPVDPILAYIASQAPAPFSATITRIEKLLRDRSALNHRIERNRDELDASALTWLIFDVSDSDAVAVGFQALGGIPPSAALADRMRADNRLQEFSMDSVYTRSPSVRSPAEVIRVARSTLCTTGRHYLLERRVPTLYTLDKGEYPDIVVLQACNNLSGDFTIPGAQSYRDIPPSFPSTVLHVLRTGVHFSYCLPFLVFCDFALFSGSDWDLALRCFTAGVTPESSLADNAAGARPIADKWAQSFAVSAAFKPLFMAAFLMEYRTRSDTEANERDLIDQLVLRLVLDVDLHAEGNTGTLRLNSFTFPPLGQSMLDFLTSERFVEGYAKDLPSHEAVALWMSSSQGALHVTPSSGIQQKFWSALSLATNATVLHAIPGVQVYFEIMIFCRERIIKCCGSGSALTAILRGILQPCTSPPLEKSLWELLCRTRQASKFTTPVYDYWDWLAQVLAAALCIQSRRHARDAAVEGIPTYVRAFLDSLEPLDVQGDYSLFVGSLDQKACRGEGLPRRSGIAHLVRHCRELDPSWSPETFQYPSGTEEERRSMVAVYNVPSRSHSGVCEWCPEELQRCAASEAISGSLS